MKVRVCCVRLGFVAGQQVIKIFFFMKKKTLLQNKRRKQAERGYHPPSLSLDITIQRPTFRLQKLERIQCSHVAQEDSKNHQFSLKREREGGSLLKPTSTLGFPPFTSLQFQKK